jgi:hypothetical protein
VALCDGRIAQTVEHPAHIREVTGSSPVPPTMIRGVVFAQHMASGRDGSVSPGRILMMRQASRVTCPGGPGALLSASLARDVGVT